MQTIKKILLLCFVICSATTLRAETEGSYVRKSISGPYSLWANEATLEAIGDMRPKLEDTIKESVRIPRFDLNQLPETLFNTARESLEKTETLSNDAISNAIKKSVVPEIEKILNDPAIQQQRIDMMKRGNEKISFAETKGKATNILSSDLETLFNSAYIYIPFTKHYKTTNNGITITTKLSAGVSWYKINTSPSGKSSVKLIETITVKAKSTKIINYKSHAYTHSVEDYIAQLIESSQYDAIEDAGRRIKLAIKKIEDFKLSGSVMESDGSEYKLNIGTLEGLQLDDAYIMMGYVDMNGEEVEKELGFLRITEVTDNQDNPEQYSTAVQQLGALQSAGGWVKEYPRTKTHFAVDLGYATGLHIDASEIPELKENATSAIVLNATLAQNLAEALGSPQLFGEIDASLGFIENTLDSGTTGSTVLASLYFNFKKKYWYRNHSTSWKLGVGYDNFTMSGTRSSLSGSEDYEYDIRALGFIFGLGYELLLTKNFSLTVDGQYKLSPFKTQASGKNSNGTFDLEASDASDQFSETHFGGAQVTIGFNYIFPSFAN